MRILISENQLNNVIRNYIKTNWLEDIVTNHGPNNSTDYLYQGKLVMKYIPSQKRMNYRYSFFLKIIIDTDDIFDNHTRGHDVHDAITEKFNLEVIKWSMM